MPIAKVQLPDGKIARFEVPEGTTQEQVITYAKEFKPQEQQEYNTAATGGRKFLQGATFGLGDEIQAAIAAPIAKAFGGGSAINLDELERRGYPVSRPPSMGELYQEGRDELRAEDKAFTRDNPKSALALEIAGGLSTGGTGAAKLAPMLKNANLLNKAKILSATGAASGGLGGYGHSEEEGLPGQLKDTAFGAAAGAVLNPVIAGGGNLALKPLRKAAEKVKPLSLYEKSVKRLEDAGVKLTTGQKTGSKKASNLESTLQGTLVGGKITKTMEEGREQFQRKLMSMAGFAQDDIEDGLITNQALDKAKKAFNSRYAKAVDDKVVRFSDDFGKKLNKVAREHAELLPPKQRRAIASVTNNFRGLLEGKISGRKYQKLRAQLGELERSNKSDISGLYGKMKKALDDEFFKSAGEEAAKVKKQIDLDYAHFKQLETIFNRNGGQAVSSGTLPLASLTKEAAKSPGTKEWKELTRSASTVFGDKAPNSGTASRALNLLMAGGGGAALAQPESREEMAAGGATLFLLSQLLGRGKGGNIKPQYQNLVRELLKHTPTAAGIATSGNINSQ